MSTNNVTDTYITVGSGKETIMPAQPAFLAVLSSTQLNVVGYNASYYFICDTEIFDQNSDYNNSTGIFTAPVTGRYVFSSRAYITGATIMIFEEVDLLTSNRTYRTALTRTASNQDSNVEITCITDMDAADTAYPMVYCGGEAANTDDLSGVSGANVNTAFSGYLAC